MGHAVSARAEFWSIYREALPALLVSLGGGLVAGLVFEGILVDLAAHPGALVLVPAFVATRGAVYGALGARIASGLHQGLLDPEFSRDRRLVAAVAASFVNGVGVAVVVAVLGWAVLGALGRTVAPLWVFLALMLVAGALTSVVMIVGLLLVVFAGFARGYDPDNLVGPIVTTLGDVFGMAFLLVALVLVEVVT